MVYSNGGGTLGGFISGFNVLHLQRIGNGFNVLHLQRIGNDLKGAELVLRKSYTEIKFKNYRETTEKLLPIQYYMMPMTT